MTGYEKSPDYGDPPGNGRLGVVVAVAVVIVVMVVVFGMK